MTTAPVKIYLQLDIENDQPLEDATWCHDRIEDYDTAYVRADITDALAERCESLRADNERLRADAARYQFLRARDLDAIYAGGVFAGQTPQNVVLNGDDLDREIDAALAVSEACHG